MEGDEGGGGEKDREGKICGKRRQNRPRASSVAHKGPNAGACMPASALRTLQET